MDNPFRLLDYHGGSFPKLERSLLKDRATELLRTQIISGHIHPGIKLTEREVGALLGISRIPARDALRELEKEGLIVSKSDGRHVIELNERDINELYQVRLVLETLAIELATRNTSPANQAALLAKLQETERALAERNLASYVMIDVGFHWLIWRQADNHHLLETLSRLVGPILMFICANAQYLGWEDTLEEHQKLATVIGAGDVQAAKEAMRRHMELACCQTLEAFQQIARTVQQGV